LYDANIFDFYGANGLLNFRASIPPGKWLMLRRINISTVFLMPLQLSGPSVCIPPEDYDAWNMACLALGAIDGLRSLRVDMTLWNINDWKTVNTVDHEALVRILGALRCIHVGLFEVEMNVEIPDSVMAVLGPLNFSIEQRHRPYGEVFMRY
jgi:hypothetical protein